MLENEGWQQSLLHKSGLFACINRTRGADGITSNLKFLTVHLILSLMVYLWQLSTDNM